MSQKLNDIYRSILKFAGLEADNNGIIAAVLDDKRTPLVHNGLQMVLPLDHQLRNFNPNEKMIFHPLTENILRGESDVISKLRSVINVRLNYTIGTVAVNLIKLVISPEFHKRLDPNQQELLTSISDADDKTLNNLVSLMINGIKEDPERVFVNIYLKRGGTYNGKRCARVGVITFPFYDKLMAGKIEKIRVKDKTTYEQLFKFMFPNIEGVEEYNFGSESQVAPYLEALMRSSANVASRLNDLLLTYSDFIEDAEAVMFDSEWIEYFNDLHALLPEIRKVPVQNGNDGNVVMSEQVDSKNQATFQPVNVPVPNQPAQQQQPQYQQTPAVNRTNRGIDFQSLVQANQTLAMTPNALGPQMAMAEYQRQMAMMQNQVPSWAIPQQMPQQMQPQMQMQLPPNVFMTPNGPCVMTPNGPMPVNLGNMMPGNNQQQIPSWAIPNNSPWR